MDLKRGGALATLLVVMVTGTMRAGGSEIVVRTFNNYGVPWEDLRDAQAEAATALNAAGINVTWIDCWHGDREAPGAPGRCREDVRGDLVLRLQQSPSGGRENYVSLGFSLVMPEGVPFLATVYADRAEGVARRAGIAPQTVLGRAIAHEIGHLLLNNNNHPNAGLMRAGWSQRELRRNDPHDWKFQESEGTMMRAALIRRNGERIAASETPAAKNE